MAIEMKASRKILIGLAALVLITAGYFVAGYYMKVPVLTQTKLFEVQAATVAGQLREDVTLNPGATTDLAFENAGKISNVLVKVGDNVKQGQLLAEEKNSDYVVALNEAVASQESSKSLVDAAKENIKVQKAKLDGLYKEKGAEFDKKAQKKTIDQSQAQAEAEESLRDAAMEAVKGAELDLAKTKLLAPADGVITSKNIEVGEVVAQAGSVMSLASGDNMEADAYVSQLDVKKLVVGDQAELIFNEVGGNSITAEAKIKSIDPAQTEANGVPSYKVALELAEQNSGLKLGMTGSANIKISEKSNAVSVPQSSIFTSGNKKYAMTLNDGIPQSKEVQTGIYGSDGMVEITSGLSVGDKIITF